MKISNREHPIVFSASDWVATRDEGQGLGNVYPGNACHGSWKTGQPSRRGVIYLPDKAPARRECT